MSLAESIITERGSISLLAHTMDPEYKLYRHTVAINRFFQRIALKPNGRGIITTAPRMGKSEAASRRGPLFVLDWMPSARIILASYGAQLAVDNGRWIRNQIEQHPDKLRVRLSEDSKKAGQWNTPQGGGVLATGSGGAMTGFGADVLVLDDLFKNWQEAHSQLIRDRVWDWWRSVARLRLQTDASVICAMTRWHQDDLIGRLLAHDEDAGRWEVLNLPALAEDDDPLGREPGEVLCPAMYTKEDVLEQMADLGPYLSASLLQQRPSAPEGELFLRSKWEFTDAAPAKPAAAVRFWDQAATKGGGDETAGVLIAIDASGAYIVDIVHGRWSSSEVEQVMAQTAELDAERWGRQGVVQMVEQEPGASGKPVRSSELVLCADGRRRPLGELVVGDEVITKDGTPSKVTAVHEQGVIPVVEVQTRLGRAVQAAPSHPFLTTRGWVPAGELRVGDVLAVMQRPAVDVTDRREPTAQTLLVQRIVRDRGDGLSYQAIADRLTMDSVETPTNAERWSASTARSFYMRRDQFVEPEVWSHADLRLMGYMLGDGSCGFSSGTQKSCLAVFTCFDDDESVDFKRCAAEIGITIRQGRDDHEFLMRGTAQDWMRATGLAGHRSWEKRVPGWVFGLPADLAAELIAGLFTTDGAVYKRAIEFHSVSPGMLRDVQHLLLRMGIGSVLRKKKAPPSHQDLNGSLVISRHQPWRLTIVGGNGGSELFSSVFADRIVHSLKRDRVMDCAGPARWPSSYMADEVTAVVDAGEADCRCITVQEGHSFTAGDVVVHNSRADTMVNDVLAAYPAEAHPSTGDKEVRAQSVSARQQAGRLFIVRREDGTAPVWATHLIEQAAEFPHGTHDDIVDALSNGYNYAAERARKGRKSKGTARSVATRGR